MSNVETVFKGEIQLAGWTVSHNTGAKISFWVPDESDLESFKLMTTRRGRKSGQRLMAVFVLIGDDELPEPAETKKVGPLTMSAIQVGKNPDFQEYVGVCTGCAEMHSKGEDEAAKYIREYCRIESRKELDTSHGSAQLFARLMEEFREWSKDSGIPR